jgi:hypothetical protein
MSGPDGFDDLLGARAPVRTPSSPTVARTFFTEVHDLLAERRAAWLTPYRTKSIRSLISGRLRLSSPSQ